MSELRAIEDKVIVSVEKESESVTASGIILSGMKEEKPNEATVVAVGPGITFNNGTKLQMGISVGDKVVFSKYQGTEVSHKGKDYLILAYRDILAIVGDE